MSDAETTRLAIAAAIATVAWLGLAVVILRITRPRSAEPGPAALALGGDEPPAIVNLLSDWRISPSALPATLIDLAARRHLDIEGSGPRCVVRPRTKAIAEPLASYEQQVLDLVKEQAIDGMIPAAALHTGPGTGTGSWWKRFHDSVVEDARRRGLVRTRWGGFHLLVMAAAAAIPIGLALAAGSGVEPAADGKPQNPGALSFVFFLVALVFIVGSTRAVRETPKGSAAQSRWLGLRDYLALNERFASLPPAAVAIWERNLAYGAALGVAPGAVEGLPLGPQSATIAWSPKGGRWHEVRISYPSDRWLGWGKPPWLVLLGGLISLAVALNVGKAVLPELGDALDAFRTSEGDDRWFDFALLAGFSVMSGAALIWGTRALVRVCRAGPDLFQRRELEGTILRVRAGGYVAVDDGRPAIKAMIVTGKHPPLVEGAVVRIRFTPRLHHVMSVEVVSQPVSS